MYTVLVIAAYLSALFLPWAAFAAIVLVCALRYRGYLCFVVAFMVDIQFGLPLPIYTTTVAALLLVAEWVRPRLIIETTT